MKTLIIAILAIVAAFCFSLSAIDTAVLDAVNASAQHAAEIDKLTR